MAEQRFLRALLLQGASHDLRTLAPVSSRTVGNKTAPQDMICGAEGFQRGGIIGTNRENSPYKPIVFVMGSELPTRTTNL